MKVLLYQKSKLFAKSGIGRAMQNQVKALKAANVDFTLNPKDDYDIIHLNSIEPKARRVAKRAQKRGKKVVFHAHSTIEDFRRSFNFSRIFDNFFYRYLLKHYATADLLLTPTNYSKSLLSQYPLNKVIIPISNGIELNQYQYHEDKVKKFKEYFNLSADDKIIMSAGFYFERKGLHDFIKVAKSLPHYKFIWFGRTPKLLSSKVIKRALKERPANVILPGYISGDIIEGAWLAADVFFFPSYEETEGIVVLEALASHCQLLIRDIPVYADWLTNHETCYKGNNNKEFIKLISDIIEQRLPKTTVKAYEVVKERSIEAIGIQLKEIYENLYQS
jgi:1,2-diacylglycerol-3-alpha-glucose alpha-1,2-glucosyltransferase